MPDYRSILFLVLVQQKNKDFNLFQKEDING